MARTKISEFSATPANNTDIDGINIAENCPPSGINDAIRELMSQLKDWQSGTSNDPYVVGSSGSLTLNQGTANGVLYLNGSKVVTSGSALTFDGTNLATTGDISLGAGKLLKYSSTAYITPENNVSGAEISTTGVITFKAGSGATEQMRLTSTGLGIGTSSPSQKLDVRGNMYMAATNARIYIDNGGVGGSSVQIGASGTSYGYIGTDGNFPLVFQPNNTERMRLDSSGNLGLGVTPSAWTAGKAIDISSNGAIFGDGATFNWAMGITQNAYRLSDGTYKYKATGQSASALELNGNVFQFKTAASGTAGNAITFTQAMTLDADGDLGIGTTSPAYKLDVSSSVAGVLGRFKSTSNYGGVIADTSTTTGGGYFGAYQNGTRYAIFSTTGAWLGDSSTDASIAAEASGGNIRFYTNGSSSERARIDSSGNLLVGTASAFSSGFVNILCDATARTPIAIKSSVNAAAAYLMRFVNNSGTDVGAVQMNGTNNGVNYLTSSDYRLKTVIGAVTGHGARLDALEPIEYEWKQNGSRSRGFLAHKFQEVYADSVSGTKDAVDKNGNPIYQGMQAGTAEVIADLVAEIQSLRKRLADAGIA
jgi:hypothetical protein